MATGSNNIIITVKDGIDASIAPKIRDIGQAAAQSANNLYILQSALNGVNTGTANLSKVVAQLTPQLNTTTQGTNRLTGAFAQLSGRVLGAEAGFGMLGGALARVGVAAGVAGPLIIAALSAAAVLGAVLAFEKYDEQQLKIAEDQVAVADTSRQLNDELLRQEETLTGLTQGTLAKYSQQLRDLSFKTIKVDLADVEKEWKAEDSFWNFKWVDTGIVKIQNLGTAILNLADDLAGDVGGSSNKSASPVPTFDVEKFVTQQKQIQAGVEQTKDVTKEQLAEIANDAKVYGEQFQTNQLNAFLGATRNVKAQIDTLNTQLAGSSGAQAKIIQEQIRQLGEVYGRDLQAYTAYLEQKKLLQAGVNGELLSEQRTASAEELRAFNDQLNQLKAGASGVVSPQQQLALRQSQLAQFDAEHPGDKNQSSPFAQTRDTLEKDIGAKNQAIERQSLALSQLVQKYQDETTGSENYSRALQTEIAQRKAAAEVLKLAPDNQNSAQALADINASIAAKIRDADTVKEETAIYNEFKEPLLRYNAAIEASNRLLTVGEINANQKAIADSQAARAQADALNPLNEYVIGLEHEVSLFGQYGTALTAATEVDRVRQELQQHGRDLTVEQTQDLQKFLEQLERQKELQQDINELYNQNAGAIEKLLIQQQALNQAKEKGIITELQFKIATADVNIALANQALLEGKTATLQDQLVAGIGKYIQGYKGLAKGISDAYGQAFQTIADGAANSIGRAIAYGEDLGDAMKNVARQAISELISAFIKLGLQWLVTEAIGRSIGESAVAANIAQAEAVALAWAPAAAFASLASFGANAAPASAGIASTVALSEVLAAVTSAFATGGLVTGGSGQRDDVLARLTGGEYVVNRQATAANRALLEQINSGANTIRPTSSGGGSSVGSLAPTINIIHDGSTKVTAKQDRDGSIRIIAQQEAEAAVHRHGPKMIESEFQNPNSKSSKALKQNYEVKQRR